MFAIYRLVEFCWKCLAKKALIVGGTAGAVAGGVMLVRRYDEKVCGSEGQVVETFRVSAPPRKSPPPQPPAAIKGMPVKIEFDDEDDQQ